MLGGMSVYGLRLGAPLGRGNVFPAEHSHEVRRVTRAHAVHGPGPHCTCHAWLVCNTATWP